jgi:hypothetical protein
MTIATKVRPEERLTGKELYNAALESYLYAYPLVLMDITRKQATNYTEPTDMLGRGPVNTISHARVFPDPTFTDVVRPNVDTLYSIAWMDLSEEPLVLTIPDTGGRYYILQFMDMWTDVFESIGSRTTGTGEQKFLFIGPDWKGRVPEDIVTIKSPTNYAWMVGRIETNGKKDYENVHRIQDGMYLRFLNHEGEEPYKVRRQKTDNSVDMKTPPVQQIADMSVDSFFSRFGEVIKKNHPHINDYPMLHRMNRIGLISGSDFSIKTIDTETLKTFERAKSDALELIDKNSRTMGTIINNWQIMSRGVGTYGSDYLQRASVAFIGLGANVPQDAIYPLTFVDDKNEQLNGNNKYRLHFEKDQVPPVKGFWSITIYNSKQLLFVNPINRYALGDRDDLKFNNDGSLDIYLQYDSPGGDKESNWLPTPREDFSVAIRLYWPDLSVLTENWAPPPVKRVR